MHMSISGLCASFSKVTVRLALPEVFCGPQICQKCVGGRGSAPNPAGGAHDAPKTPCQLARGIPYPHFPTPLSTHNSIRKYFVGNLVTAAPPQYPSAQRLCPYGRTPIWDPFPCYPTRHEGPVFQSGLPVWDLGWSAD